MDTTIVSVAADYQVALRRINVSLPIELIEELLDLMGQLKDTAKVRQTEDGRYSVLNFIGNVVEKGSPREVWKRVLEVYPEVVTLCDNLQFPGMGQRLTPVATEIELIYVATLLPGEFGNRLRRASAQLVVEALAGYRGNLNLLFAKTDTATEISTETAAQLKTALTSFPNTLEKLWKTSGIVSKYQVKNAVLRDFVDERDYIWADNILCLNDSTFHILAISFRSLKGADVDQLPEIIQLKTREYFRYQADKKMNRRIAQDCEWEQPLLPLVY